VLGQQLSWAHLSLKRVWLAA